MDTMPNVSKNIRNSPTYDAIFSRAVYGDATRIIESKTPNGGIVAFLIAAGVVGIAVWYANEKFS